MAAEDEHNSSNDYVLTVNGFVQREAAPRHATQAERDRWERESENEAQQAAINRARRNGGGVLGRYFGQRSQRS